MNSDHDNIPSKSWLMESGFGVRQKIMPSVDLVLRCDVFVRKGTSRKCAVSASQQIVRSDHTSAELHQRVDKWKDPRRGRCVRAVLTHV